MGKTSIEWTGETWNPVRGCSRISPGCVNCYAERMAARFVYQNVAGEGGESQKPGVFHGFAVMRPSGPHWTGKVELIPHMLDVPLKRRKPTTYFVNSMSDLFHEGLPFEDIDRVFAVMALCPQHTFQCLTKRADRMREYFTKEIPLSGRDELVAAQAAHTGRIVWDARGSERHNYFGCGQIGDISNRRVFPGWPLPNVHLGVSVEDQQRKERIDMLRETPAAVRFLSLEPLLEDLGTLDLRGIGWCIVGGESGPGARPLNVDWVTSIVEQCKAAGTACFSTSI